MGISNIPIKIDDNYLGGLLLPEIGKLDKPTSMTYAIVTTEMKYLNDQKVFV